MKTDIPELPSYLEYREGQCPVVIVAPHGGTRARGVRRSDGINDVYTAELAHALAERINAFAVVNARLDRNETDLNRISEIAAQAPAVARALRHAVERAGELAKGDALGPAPLVLWLHGWNVSSRACDIGIGLREFEGVLDGIHPTVRESTVAHFVEPLRRALAARGLDGFVGHRYAASGKDNATQIFSGRHVGHDNDDVAALSRLALAGGADAVQLELSISLRWPGTYRESWLDALEEAVAVYTSRASVAAPLKDARAARGWSIRRERTRDLPAGEVARGETIQAVLSDGSGLFLGAEPTSAQGFASRICIARPGGQLALLVCEAPWSGRAGCFESGGLAWETGGPVRYRGPAVVYASHEAFVDLEHGLRSARLAEIEIEFDADQAAKNSECSMGSVRIGDEVLEVSRPWRRHPGGRLAGGGGVARRVVLGAGGANSLVVEDYGEQSRGKVGAADSAAVRAVVGHIDAGAGKERLTLRADTLREELSGRVSVRVPVYRPAPGGGFVRAEFGVVEWMNPGAYARYGLFETVEKLPPRRA